MRIPKRAQAILADLRRQGWNYQQITRCADGSYFVDVWNVGKNGDLYIGCPEVAAAGATALKAVREAKKKCEKEASLRPRHV